MSWTHRDVSLLLLALALTYLLLASAWTLFSLAFLLPDSLGYGPLGSSPGCLCPSHGPDTVFLIVFIFNGKQIDTKVFPMF